jgi:hypothetical protein
MFGFMWKPSANARIAFKIGSLKVIPTKMTALRAATVRNRKPLRVSPL